LGLLNSIHNLLFFIAINLGDPTLAAFFSRSETVYSVLLGAWLLDERMGRHQWVGAGVAVLGAGLITFRAGKVVWLMLVLLLVSNFFLSLSTLVAKKEVIAVPPLVLSTARTVVMSMLLGSVSLATGELAWPAGTTWLWIIGGAFFGPFLSYVLFYRGLLYLDMAKGVIIRSMQPLFVAVYSLILFGTIITVQQFAGGMLMIVGIVVMLWERQRAGLGVKGRVKR
jgi:drug/metabolite transporter (DMT)-like permease